MESEIIQKLENMRDAAYGQFQQKLLPSVPADRIIGVRTPELRKFAKALPEQDAKRFLADLPHFYFDENQLHAFLLSNIKDFEACASLVSAFLPFVDNWATCDQLSPKCFSKHRQELLPYIHGWLASEHPYTVRFAIGMLMQHYLDEAFDPAYLETVSKVRSEEYYVNMMIAWYFATALAKQYSAALPYLENRRLSPWVHQKTIQKAAESYRIGAERKEYLRSLR